MHHVLDGVQRQRPVRRLLDPGDPLDPEEAGTGARRQ
jgi:hypothetical protein